MVCILAKDPVIAHHPHTMTIRLSGFCRTSRTLPRRGTLPFRRRGGQILKTIEQLAWAPSFSAWRKVSHARPVKPRSVTAHHRHDRQPRPFDFL
jgi:hypothetical protein